MATTPEVMLANIATLESDLVEAKRALKAADATLAASYGAGGDTAKALADATKARDRVASLIAALPQLDQQWIEAAEKARQDAVDAIWKERDASYEEFEKTLNGIIPEVKTVLDRVASGAVLEAAVKDVRTKIADVAWESLEQAAGVKVDALPPWPAKKPPRGLNGLPKKYEQGFWKDVPDTD